MKIRIPKCFVIVFAIGLLSVFAMGCGGGGGNGDDDDDQSLSITGESGNQVKLNGDWDTGCLEVAGGESLGWITTISGSNVSQEENDWFDSTTCNGTSDLTMVIRGKFDLGNEVTADLNGADVTATEIDFEITSFKATIYNQDAIDDFNASEECGFDDWVAGTPKELLGTDCGPDDENVKDVLYIDDTADPDVLYFGDEDGANDGNGYPAEIESDEPQERV